MTDGVRIETAPANFKKVMAMRDDLLAFCRAAGFQIRHPGPGRDKKRFLG